MLSMTTDYKKDVGCPEPYLRRIAEAGFTHVHWCHHWNSDFIYSQAEIDQIARWLKAYGLQLNDLHASDGVEKCWVSPLEYERLAGVELVKNRMNMAAQLGSDVIIMHVDPEPEEAQEKVIFWNQLQKSLDELEPYARTHGVRIAVENLFDDYFLQKHPNRPLSEMADNFDEIERLFATYAPDYIGLCYDSGHGNVGRDRMKRLEPLKERLIALHLHDNDGTGDHHQLPFSQTIDWDRLARLIAESSYHKCVSLEVVIRRTDIKSEEAFLQKAFETGTKFAQMIEEHKR